MALTWKPLTAKNFKDTLTPGLALFFKQAGITGKMNADQTTADFKASMAVALQAINWIINGSVNESVKPPIKFGILRGSGSAFVNGVFVGDTKASYSNGKPNKAYRGKGITIGFNTAYAARLHEIEFVPGGKIPSKQAKRNPGILENVGNKYVEKHLKADGTMLWRLYAEIFKKEMNG